MGDLPRDLHEKVPHSPEQYPGLYLGCHNMKFMVTKYKIKSWVSLLLTPGSGEGTRDTIDNPITECSKLLEGEVAIDHFC